MSDYDNHSSTNPSFYQILHAHKRPMIWAFSCVMLVAIAVTFLGPKIYMSEAKLFVRLGRESLSLDPTATTGQMAMVQEPRESEINSVFELIKSRLILDRVVSVVGAEAVLGTEPEGQGFQSASLLQGLDIFAPYSLKDEATRQLAKHLTVVAIKKSNVINVSYEAKSPELARDVVATLLDQARDAHLRVNRTPGSQEFFAAQVEQLRGKLVHLETALRDLKNKSGVASLGEQRAIKLKQIGELQDAALKAEATLSGSTAQMLDQQVTLQEIPDTIATDQTTGMPNSKVAAMRQQLFGLEMHEKELLSKYTASHPLAIVVRDQLGALKKVLAQEDNEPQVSHGPNAAHREIHLAYLHNKSTAASLRAHAETLREQLAAARQELIDINDQEVEIARLSREIEIETANYRKYSENLEQARIDHELEAKNISNLNILQPPTYSITPIRPRHALNLALGLIGGLASSLIVGLFLAQRRNQLFHWPVGPGAAQTDSAVGLTNGRFEHHDEEESREFATNGTNHGGLVT